MFAQPISMSLNGNTKTKSCAGGLLSVFIEIYLVVFFIQKIIFVASYDDWNLDQQVTVLSNFDLFEKVDFKKQTNFTVGIELAPSPSELDIVLNETLYGETVDTIKKFTKIVVENNEHNG